MFPKMIRAIIHVYAIERRGWLMLVEKEWTESP